MVKVNIVEVISHLDTNMKKALERTVISVLPDADIIRNELFKAFVKAVSRECSTWEFVPDCYVKK